MSARAGAEDAYILTRTVGGAVTATTAFTSVIRELCYMGTHAANIDAATSMRHSASLHKVREHAAVEWVVD